MSQTSPSKLFVIQSKIDNQIFTVDQRIIESSTLLKNICDITDITEPIIVNCSADSLKLYINLIQNYQTINENEHDKEFEKNLYETFTSKDKQKLILLIQDLCILDSDFFLDSIADYILGIFDEDKMEWSDMKEFLGVENDFSEAERELLSNDQKLEYFLSLDTETFKFPFQNKALYSLKTDFITPMNCLIARIVQRSNERISFALSMINKTLKNEVDRYPYKVSNFHGIPTFWILSIDKVAFYYSLNYRIIDEKYFSAMIKRRVIAMKKFRINYNEYEPKKLLFIQSRSFDFVISNNVEIHFDRTVNSIYQFDITKCRCPSISYEFLTLKEQKMGIKFEEIYDHLIAKDLSKNITLQTMNIFKFFPKISLLRFYKMPIASKFYKLEIIQHENINPYFKTFVMDYMEDDGLIKSSNAISGIPGQIAKNKGFYDYRVSIVKKYLECI